MKNISIGADIGGSHITCRLFDITQNQFADSRAVRIPVNSNSPKEEILSAWTSAILETAKGTSLTELCGIGFAMPGPFDYYNGIALFKGVKKFDALYGLNIRQELLNRLNLPGNFPIRFLNDAACFAIGESLLGQARDFDRILAITLGTGFGTTFIEHHIPIAGKNGVPEDGFLYHIPFKNAIADEYFSTRWFVKEYQNLSGHSINGVKELTHTAIHDHQAQELFRVFGSNLGSFLVPWLKRFNADCLVIGGNISAAYGHFKNELQNELQKAELTTTIFTSKLQEDAALSGSASLCNDDIYNKLIKS